MERTEPEGLCVIVTLCAHCGRVRLEDGSWAFVEPEDLADSRTAISHGFCQRCCQVHYGDHALMWEGDCCLALG